ncbi:MAG: EAL domain-containing protein [Gammaproteobacteria bacterium]|nr:MAG: EAL domain-containing protein [Gammaproteobacteria bacterium]
MSSSEEANLNFDSHEKQLQVYFVFTDILAGQRLANQVRNYGYKARVFGDFDSFSQAAIQSPPQTILVDTQLITDTYLFKDKLFHIEHTTGKNIPIIAISEQGDIQTRIAAIESGASIFIQQPVNMASMLNHLDQLCHLGTIEQEKVLLISDGSENIERTVSALKKFDMSVTCCNLPERILDVMDETAPDVLLLNGDITGIDAIQLAKIIRQEEQFFDTPVLMLTKRDKRIFDELVYDAGIDALLGLPISEEDLAAIIRSKVHRAYNLRREYRYLAKHDAKTGLFNKDYFYEKVSQAIAMPSTTKGSGTIIYIKLKDIPELAESNSTSYKRAIAISVGNVLRSKITPPNICACLSSDVFAILSYSTDEREIESAGETIRQSIDNASVSVNGKYFDPQVDIGVCLISGQIKSASTAILRAKNACHATTHFDAYARTQEQSAEITDWQQHWTKQISNALQDDQFRLVYQPIANLGGHPESLYEVFLRMQDDHGSDILPQEFLPFAEQAGLSNKIDRWVIDHAVHVLSEQIHMGHKPILFIKLFPASIQDSDLPLFIEQRFLSTGIDSSRFVFQITQQSAIDHLDAATGLTHGLKKIGSKIVIEHFGKNPAQDEIMGKLDFDFIKIDGSLVVDINTNIESQNRIIKIAEAVSQQKARTIASLVQDASSLAVLYRCGVDYIQGYFMQEPADIFSPEEQLKN